MTILDRLKLELANKQYFNDFEYEVFLAENGLKDIKADYDKATNQLALLQTVRDIFEALSNNIELFMKVQTEFTTVSSAYSNLNDRINNIEKRIAELPNYQATKTFTCLYYN